MYEKYISLDEKLDIGRAAYKQELSKNAACNQYGIKLKTVIECLRVERCGFLLFYYTHLYPIKKFSDNIFS